MKKLALILSLIIALPFLQHCTTVEKVVCSAETKVEQTLPGLIQSGLQCNNLAAIQASVTASAPHLNFCPANPAGPVANLLCPDLTTLLVGGAANAVLPAAWDCHPTNLTNGAAAALTTLCEQISL